MNIGVLSVQGSFKKHVEVFESLNINTFNVKYKDDLNNLDALVIPGGESTAITKIINENNLYIPLKNFIFNKPILATCAGMIILSTSISINNKPETRVKSFNVLDIKIDRNGWGRQVHSFIKNITINLLNKDIDGIFIRAPKISTYGNNIEILASIESSPVMIKMNNIIATTFHPELSNNTVIHEYFINHVNEFYA